MNSIEWSDALQLHHEPMDHLHREFVVLLALAQNAPDSALAAAWTDVLDHTVVLFGREDEWMRSTHHACADRHSLAHRVVLNVLREGLCMARAGDLAPVREMASELAVWFVKHTQTLDAELSQHLQREATKRAPDGRGAQQSGPPPRT